jgi:two-component system, OmpR family, response regulator
MALTDADVPLVPWPSETVRRDDLARLGRARLLLIEERHDPPPLRDALEDWVRAGVDPIELYVRRERLRRQQARQAPAQFDDDGLLRRGDRWVAVSPLERRLVEPLLARAGHLVPRSELLAATVPGAVADDRRRLDRIVRRVRLRLAPLGITVHAVRGSGFLLELNALP